jgi:hypothetical protein
LRYTGHLAANLLKEKASNQEDCGKRTKQIYMVIKPELTCLDFLDDSGKSKHTLLRNQHLHG